MGPRTILVDGYNVIRKTAGLKAAERVSLSAGREALLALLKGRYLHTPHRVVVVFDGYGSCEATYPLRGLSRGQVIFTPTGCTADTVIQRLAAQERAAGAEVVVVSDDAEVCLGVAASGGQAARVDDLARTLNAPGKYQRRLAQHRQFIRAEWEQEGDDWEQRRDGNPHKAPRRKRKDRYGPLP